MPLSRPLMPASLVQVCSALTRPTKLFFAVEASPALAAWLTVLRLENTCCAASLVWADVLTVSAALRNSATHEALQPGRSTPQQVNLSSAPGEDKAPMQAGEHNLTHSHFGTVSSQHMLAGGTASAAMSAACRPADFLEVSAITWQAHRGVTKPEHALSL